MNADCVSDKIKIPIEIEQKILSRFIAMSERNISAIKHIKYNMIGM